MARLLLRIIIEGGLSIVFFLIGVWLLGVDGSLPVVLAVASIIVGFLLMAHIVLAAAFGKVPTPFDYGAGHRVPGSRNREPGED